MDRADGRKAAYLMGHAGERPRVLRPKAWPRNEKEARMNRSSLQVWCLALLGAALLTGCQIGAIAGGMIESYKRDSTHEVKAEYTGLGGKDFAVVVSADRMIQAEQPDLVQYLTGKITERLAANTNVPRATGLCPLRMCCGTCTHTRGGRAGR